MVLEACQSAPQSSNSCIVASKESPIGSIYQRDPLQSRGAEEQSLRYVGGPAGRGGGASDVEAWRGLAQYIPSHRPPLPPSLLPLTPPTPHPAPHTTSSTHSNSSVSNTSVGLNLTVSSMYGGCHTWTLLHHAVVAEAHVVVPAGSQSLQRIDGQ